MASGSSAAFGPYPRRTPGGAVDQHHGRETSVWDRVSISRRWIASGGLIRRRASLRLVQRCCGRSAYVVMWMVAAAVTMEVGCVPDP